MCKHILKLIEYLRNNDLVVETSYEGTIAVVCETCGGEQHYDRGIGGDYTASALDEETE